MDGLYLEIWQEPNGYTSLIYSGEMGDEARKLLAIDSKLLKTIFARSHFEAMTVYYQFMGWGEYNTIYEMDKRPYSEWFNKKTE